MIIGVKYLKVSDVKDGDLIKICDEGKWVESTKFKNPDGTNKQQCQFEVETASGEKRILTLNKINRENLIGAWGYETKNWVGKLAEIFLKEAEVAGENKTVIRLKASE